MSQFALSTESKPGYASFGTVIMQGTQAQADQYAALHLALENIEVTVKPTNVESTAELCDEIEALAAELKDGIIDGIKEAIAFTDSDELGDFDGFADETEIKLATWVSKFLLTNGDRLIPQRNSRHSTPGCIGNDVWYTTQGHGCGFWETDRYTDESWASWANTYCKAHRLGDAYKGDDGLIYLM